MENSPKANALTKIRSRMFAFSDSEKRVAEWIMEHVNAVLYLSMSQIAQACSVSDTTVLRMCRIAGFEGFTDLKLSLAQVIAVPTQLAHENITPADDPLTIVRKVFATNIQSLNDTLATVDEASLVKAVTFIESARQILIGGVGGSAIVAQSMYQRFYRLGVHCDAPADVQLQVMHASILKPGDLAIAISYSGTTRDTVLMLAEAQRNGANTILFTGNPNSRAAEHASLVFVSVSDELGGDTVAARIAQLTLVDSLYMLYSFRHPDETLDVEKRFIKSLEMKS
jgi:DNA-binding MurR/RpiR family transcriptional regulator